MTLVSTLKTAAITMGMLFATFATQANAAVAPTDLVRVFGLI